jgi:hypothetical protein
MSRTGATVGVLFLLFSSPLAHSDVIRVTADVARAMTTLLRGAAPEVTRSVDQLEDLSAANPSWLRFFPSEAQRAASERARAARHLLLPHLLQEGGVLGRVSNSEDRVNLLRHGNVLRRALFGEERNCSPPTCSWFLKIEIESSWRRLSK